MSLYQDSHLSEIIYTWTMGTIILWHPMPGYMPGDGAKGQNLELFKLLYFKFFSGVHILAATDHLDQM